MRSTKTRSSWLNSRANSTPSAPTDPTTLKFSYVIQSLQYAFDVLGQYAQVVNLLFPHGFSERRLEDDSAEVDHHVAAVSFFLEQDCLATYLGLYEPVLERFDASPHEIVLPVNQAGVPETL